MIRCSVPACSGFCMTLMCDLKRLQCLRAMAKKIAHAPAVKPVEPPSPEAAAVPKRRRVSEKSNDPSHQPVSVEAVEAKPAEPAEPEVEFLDEDANSSKKKRRRKHRAATAAVETVPETAEDAAGSPAAIIAGDSEPTAAVAEESVGSAAPPADGAMVLVSQIRLPCRRSASAPADRATSFTHSYDVQNLKEWHVATDCGRKPWTEELFEGI